MTGTRQSTVDVEAVRAAVALAVRAPSIHNSQPWRWEYGPHGLDLYADRTRQLGSIDPDGRGLLVSCGAALWLAQLSLAAQGWPVSVLRSPDPARPDLVARIEIGAWCQPDVRTRALAAAAGLRRSERRPFGPEPVSEEILDELCRLVRADGAYASLVRRADDRLDLAVATAWADSLEMADPAFREELGRWVRPDAASAGVGIPPSAVPHLPAGQVRHSDVPLRDFEVRMDGAQPAAAVDERPGWLVVFTGSDEPVDRLLAGEVFAHLSVQAARMGLASSAATQAVDLPEVRDRIRVLMDWPDHAQMVVRVGWPPAGDPAPPTPRLRVEDVLRIRPSGADQ